MARAAKAMAIVREVAGNKEGNGENSKGDGYGKEEGDGDGNMGGRQQRGQ